MMKPLDIDFVDRSLWRRPLASRQRQILIGIGVAEALTALVVVWQWRQLDGQLDETKQAIALARQEIVARTPPVPAPLLLSEPQIVAINSAIGQLNTPWPALLDGFERVASTDIALLQIEPDHRRRLVKGVAEARDHQRMVDYLELLGSVAPFAGAMVTRQEVNEKDPNRPLRFMFEALLDDSAAVAVAAEGEQTGSAE
ncbi:conserved hypothetical protein [Candidatus Accumulibacter aalborgensis]|uniref:Fimbrial assembly family protein n=1 Tax=Candidatus Accumulibacter aalborgensis TaxID=1860102 RepID=A0A1A8XLT6_9PROT|nr:hypothetical protein [Candidatus Accumulibacter aalborgensis]SBT06110.1 conserved hypothetical protein [Candidatus Accumulibacter aalborgensis]